MAFDMETVRTALVNVLTENTATLAGSLTAGAINAITRGMPGTQPKGIHQYPAIWVAYAGQTPDWAELGPSARRTIRPRLRIVGAVQGTAESNAAGGASHITAETQAATLADNIQNIINANITLSQTVAWFKVTEVEYNYQGPGFAPEAHVSAVRIETEGFTFDT